MVRKFLLVGVTVWLARDASYQIYGGLWVLLASFMLHVVLRPYKDSKVGFLETLSLGAVLASLLLGNAIALATGLAVACYLTVVRSSLVRCPTANMVCGAGLGA